MRAWLALLLVLALLGVAVAGCGGGEEASPLPETVVTDEGDGGTDGETETETEGETDTGGGTTTDGGENGETGDGGENGGGGGDPEAGSEVFASAGCGSCHTLAEAGTSGAVGPNLDDAQPPYEAVVTVVTNGRGAMPPFGDQLSEEEIQNVAAFVSQSAGG